MSQLFTTKKVLFVFLVMLMFLVPFSVRTACAQIPKDADEAFHSMLDKLKREGVISSTDGESVYYGDYTDEWAQINYYQWLTFEHSNRFVFSATVSWTSASTTPNNFVAGCGVTFNSGSGSGNHLLASIRMDGLVYFDGFRNGYNLSYGTYKYDRPSIKGTKQMVLVVDGDKATMYLDGERFVRKADLPIMGDGVGLSTLSGTNKDFGTRCEWEDIFFYTW